MNKHTILIIDDNTDILEILQSTLQEDYQVLKACNAQDGLQMLEANKVDLIITDQRMPGMTGIEFLEKTLDYQIELIEQPTVHWDIAGLKYVTQHSRVPIMADETVHSPSDVIRLANEAACDLINIKIMKSGGILRSHEIATVCQAAGIGCMLGAMAETKIGMAAATHLAASHPNILYADLDGHFDLAGDPTKGGFELKEGCNYAPDTPGIGREIDSEAMKPFLI